MYEYSKTGDWCFRNGEVCDNHVSTSPFPLKNGEQCLNRFYGLCDKGDRYLPESNDPDGRQATIKRCTMKEGYPRYDALIGQTIDIEEEVSDAVYVRIDGRLYPIWLRDCILSYKDGYLEK
ncbi:hypothetical protein ACFVS2_20335 [Brevibacillus sp. NPDC058079]|uniref:hypothetical protein n=1 Tax=Brevibacillus sp. NPDC058079 TaxID=3346330 RepID=UPI0036E0F8AF